MNPSIACFGVPSKCIAIWSINHFHFQQQYIFIHHCLLYVLEGRENDTGYPPHPQYPKPVPPPVIGQPGLPVLPPPPRIEVHQNPAFEDDEGIAESGV